MKVSIISFRFTFPIFLIGLLFCSLVAQETDSLRVLLTVKPDTVWIPPDSIRPDLKLPHHFLIPGSEKINLGKFRLLKSIHFTVDYRSGTLHFTQQLPSRDTLQVIYRKYPFPLVYRYTHRQLEEAASSDSSADPNLQIARETQPNLLSGLEDYQANLQKSGSIVRGIQIGSNQDLSLNSGLNLQLSGFITPQVELVAALTDESTPIQPEGNTQTLREVDKVFVKIKSPYVSGTLGDFNIQYQQSQFGNVQRKLQGLTFSNQMAGTEQQLTFGTSRGTFHTNRFLGQEGKQGPYQLTGKNGERDILVLAGTERVYVDGTLQDRGENNDYVIDYGLAQITFTNKNLITSQSRIEVDFEYAEAFQRYGKNFLGISSHRQSPESKVFYDVRLFREWDDTRNLLEDSAPLSDAERQVLETAGDNPLNATISGAESVQDGQGNYVRADTLIADSSLSYFRYVGAGKGNYQVRFSNVGLGEGDYRRTRLGVYEFVGPGKGDFLPIKLIPLAGDKQFASMQLGYRVSRQFNLAGEWGISKFDRNVFSPLNDEDNLGQAFRLSAELSNSVFRIGGKNLGSVRFLGRFQNQEARFSPLDRPFRPEYTYKWNLQEGALSNNREKSFEGTVGYQPFSFLQVSGNAGVIEKGAGISSRRGVGNLDFKHASLPELSLQYEVVESESPGFTNSWLRRKISLKQRLGALEPQLSMRNEDRRQKERSGQVTGFAFTQGAFQLKIFRFLGTDLGISTELREDKLYDPEVPFKKLKQALTGTYGLEGTLLPGGSWQGRFSLVYRRKDYTSFFEKLPADSLTRYQPDPQFQDTTWQDRQSHLANLELQYRNHSGSIISKIDYKASSELEALREKVYLDVGENRGNFRFDETLGEYVPDPQGNFFLVVVPTGSFQSVSKIETAWRFQYRPLKLQRRDNFLEYVLVNTSFQSYMRIEEESRLQDFWQLYVLNLSKFHTTKTTLRGVFLLNHDLLFFEKNPDWGIQIRSRYRDNLSNQFLDAGNNETRIIWERSIQIRKRLFGSRLNVIAGYENSLNKRFVSALASRNRNIISQVLSAELRYRPSYRWQLNLNADGGIEKNRDTANFLKLNFWKLRPAVVYAIRGRARVSADVTALKVNVLENPFEVPVPFEMARGKKEGFSWLWNSRFEYFLSTNVTISATYTGRKDALASQVIHLGKAEVRAFF